MPGAQQTSEEVAARAQLISHERAAAEEPPEASDTSCKRVGILHRSVGCLDQGVALDTFAILR